MCEIKINVNGVFDTNNELDMLMLGIFTAREDIYKINILLQQYKNNSSMFLFLFKQVLSITRNCYMLLYKIFEQKNALFCEFPHYEEILNNYYNLTDINGGNEKNSFAGIVLKKIRDRNSHYDDIASSIKNILDEQQITSSFIIGDTASDFDYTFANDIAYSYFKKQVAQYKDFDTIKFTKVLADFSIFVTKILELLISDYFEKYTDLGESNFDGIEIHRINT